MKKGMLAPKINLLEKVKDLQGAKLAYAIVKNKKAMTKEVEILQEIAKPSDEYQKYDKARVALCEQYSKKEDGKPIMVNNEYQIEDKETFEKEIKTLGEKNKETIDAYKKQIEDVNKLLGDDAEVSIHKVQMDVIPEDITIEQLEILDFMIEEEGEPETSSKK